MNKNFKNMSIGAIASVIAGAYYLYGSKEGQAKRKQIHAWSVKMRGEVLQGIEKLKEVSEPKYKEVVKAVAAKYKQVDKGELKKVVDDMMSTWNKMKKEVASEIAKKDAQIKKETATKSGAKKTVAKKTAPKKKPATKKTVSKKVEPMKETPVSEPEATDNQPETPNSEIRL
jgi:cell division septation protein DedD